MWLYLDLRVLLVSKFWFLLLIIYCQEQHSTLSIQKYLEILAVDFFGVLPFKFFLAYYMLYERLIIVIVSIFFIVYFFMLPTFISVASICLVSLYFSENNTPGHRPGKLNLVMIVPIREPSVIHLMACKESCST